MIMINQKTWILSLALLSVSLPSRAGGYRCFAPDLNGGTNIEAKYSGRPGLLQVSVTPSNRSKVDFGDVKVVRILPNGISLAGRNDAQVVVLTLQHTGSESLRSVVGVLTMIEVGVDPVADLVSCSYGE